MFYKVCFTGEKFKPLVEQFDLINFFYYLSLKSILYGAHWTSTLDYINKN